MEQWKPVVGYEGLYEVSDQGRVKSLNYRRTGREQLLSPRPSHGYHRVALNKNGYRKDESIHCLVAEAFIGPCPAGHEVCHYPDPRKTNNALTNLRYDTRSGNSADDQSKGGRRMRDLTDQDRIDIHEIWRRGLASVNELCRHYAVSSNAIWSATNSPGQIRRLIKGNIDLTQWECPEWVKLQPKPATSWCLTDVQRSEVISKHAGGDISVHHLALEYGVSQSAIRGLIKRHRAKQILGSESSIHQDQMVG